MRWLRRVTGAEDREVRRIVKQGLTSSHMHIEKVFELCAEINEEIIKPRLVAYEMADASLTPYDRGNYSLSLVFMKESDMASVMGGDLVEIICEEATALALSAGQNPGFEIYRSIYTYDQVITMAGSWKNYMRGLY